MAQGMAVADNATDDCCNDTDTQALTGQMCKTGQTCPLLSVTGFSDLDLPSVAPAVLGPIASATPFALSTDPVGVWRPPSFL
jgi:hypothetical protein